MSRENASGLAGAGALVAVFSLMLPWYSVEVSGALAAQAPTKIPDLGHQSGWEALGGLQWVILALAVLTGLRGAMARSPALPALAAAALLAVVGWRYLDPPTLTETAGGLPAGTDPMTAGFVEALAEQIGLGVSPAYGLAVAAAGAGLALYAALSSAPARARP